MADRRLDKKLGKLVYGFEYPNDEDFGEVEVYFNGRYFPLPHYSTNLPDMHRLIEAIARKGLAVGVVRFEREGRILAHASCFSVNEEEDKQKARDYSATKAYALAIEKYFDSKVSLKHAFSGEDDDATTIINMKLVA
jgi:hypothetical protein